MSNNIQDEELAKKRWSILQLLRFGGALTVLLGIVVISGRLIDLPALGYVLLVAGAIGFFALPVTLAKRWKSPDR